MSVNLRDRVFNDTGGVVQGATVQAILVTGGGTDVGTSSVVQSTTTTDVNGMWKFVALPDPGAGNWYDVKIINGNQVRWRYGNIQAVIQSLLLQSTVWASPHFTAPVVDSGGLTVTAGGLQVTAGNVGIGAAPKATWGINVSEAMSSDNSNAFGIAVSGSTVLTATANSVSMYGLELGPAFVINGKTGLTLGGINVEAITGGAGATSTYGINIGPVTGGGTNNYGVYINAPSGASSNNIGLFVAGGGSYGIQNNGSAILCGAGTNMGFFGVANAKQTVTGAKGGNAALASLLSALVAYGLVVDSTTA